MPGVSVTARARGCGSSSGHGSGRGRGRGLLGRAILRTDASICVVIANVAIFAKAALDAHRDAGTNRVLGAAGGRTRSSACLVHLVGGTFRGTVRRWDARAPGRVVFADEAVVAEASRGSASFVATNGLTVVVASLRTRRRARLVDFILGTGLHLTKPS